MMTSLITQRALHVCYYIHSPSNFDELQLVPSIVFICLCW